MRVDNSRGITIAKNYRREELAPAGTSLVPVEPAAPVESRQYRMPRTLATFVTQLIAKEQDALHTRVRCRAEPTEGAESYRKMLNIGGIPNRYKTRPY
jgi:hypothetical protein